MLTEDVAIIDTYFCSPNSGFRSQLKIFHQASFKVSKQDKGVRMFYLERMVKEVMSQSSSDLPNDGSLKLIFH